MEHLKKTIVSFSYRMCLARGTDEYSRIDGLPLTSADIATVSDLCNGQENIFTVSPDGLTIRHRWLCDSSD